MHRYNRYLLTVDCSLSRLRGAVDPLERRKDQEQYHSDEPSECLDPGKVILQ